jgi:hypothetical protein
MEMFNTMKPNHFQNMAEFPLNRSTIVMLTDPGAEIDDEILIHLLMNSEKKMNDVYIVCVPGITKSATPSTEEIDQAVEERIQRVRSIFPLEFGNNTPWMPEPNDATTSIFNVCSHRSFLSTLSSIQYFHVTTLLQVAPLWHVPPELLEKLHIETRIFMGDLSNPEKSINGTKAMPLGRPRLREIYAQQESILQKNSTKTIDIPTSFARQVPTPFRFIMSLPETMKEPLLNTAFTQFVGRPNPSLPWAEDISVANHATILKMLPSNIMYDILENNGSNVFDASMNCLFTEQTIAFMPECHSTKGGSTKICEDFKEDLKQFQKEMWISDVTSTTIDVKNIRTQHLRNIDVLTPKTQLLVTKYSKRIRQIAQAVYYITRVPYKQTEGFNEDALVDKEIAKSNWFKYIQTYNCNMTPFYDGLAWIVMKEGKLPSLEECHDRIKTMC